MRNLIDKVDTSVTIYFANELQYELPLKDESSNGLDTYGVSIKPSEKLYNSSSSNIVGNICGNTLSLEIISKDKLLSPNNTDSIYFGYMNDTAYIDIKCRIPQDENKEVCLGRYFVTSWEGATSSASAYNITISAVDLMSKIKNMSLEKIRLKRKISFNGYIKYIIDYINSKLPDHMKILYTDEDLRIFKDSSYSWQMYFNNINRTSVEAMLNDIALYAACYIWIDRNRRLKTMHLLEDNKKEPVGLISGSVNVTEYTNQSGDISNYSGVNVKYIDSINYEDAEILSINNIELKKGINVLDNQKISNSNVYSIEHVVISCDNGIAKCVSFDNYKDMINMNIEASCRTKASIRVYGQVIKENYKTITQYKDNNNQNSTIQIENKVLIKNLIRTYATGLINIMKTRDNVIKATGWLNPSLELGDTVTVSGRSLNINEDYIIVGLDFKLGSNYSCTATLDKYSTDVVNIEDILYEQRQLLEDELDGASINSEEIKELSSKDNRLCEINIKESIEELRGLLGGEV